MLEKLGLVSGAQQEVKEKHRVHIPASVYDNEKLSSRLIGKTNVTASDKAHPTDRVYKLFWDYIKAGIRARQFAFGRLG